MSDTKAATVHPLSTYAGTEALFKAKGRCLRRDDFPATPEGWTMWCDHRVRKYTSAAKSATENKDYWARVRGGEHLQDAVTKLEELNKALAKVKELEAQIAASKK
jgi:hypothetical protein